MCPRDETSGTTNNANLFTVLFDFLKPPINSPHPPPLFTAFEELRLAFEGVWLRRS